MSASLKRLPARFYRSNNGREPVREWLKSLEPGDRTIIGEDIKDVESRGRSKCLWCVQSTGNCGKSQAACPAAESLRVVFCVERDYMVLLHGFMKKTQERPQREIDLAIRRLKGTGA